MSNPLARVVVFIDYMNVYEDFRRAFCTGTLLPTHGQFDPVTLARLVASKGPDHEEWRLSGVRVYSGRHTPDAGSDRMMRYTAYARQDPDAAADKC